MNLKLILLSGFFLLSCGHVVTGQALQHTSPQVFEKKLKEQSSFTLLDVRTQSEYDRGHIESATLLDFYRSDFRTQVNKLDKSKPVFVYCAVGGRSNAAVSLLSELGFRQVYNLAGGIQNWVQAQKPIVK